MNEFFAKLISEFQIPLQNPVLVFALILFIILLSPIILRKLHIPGIIGLIISGVIIGPHALNILERNSAVNLFSTIGLLYIMFIAGLELDLNEFKKYRYKSLMFGFFTFAIPLTIGFPICYYILQFDFLASLLTASMFSTHTLVAYPIVSKLGVSKNQAVAITVGGTILTDTAVLILFAVILGWNEGALNSSFWMRMGISITIFSILMFFVIPKVARWFFKKLESEKHSHYIFVLSVVFFAAFLAQASGLEPIIGAFVAGLALNRLIPSSSALMNRIEFIGNSLFIPFFLITVGMIVDVGVILKGPNALIVAGVLTVVALIGKWVAAFFTQIIFKYTKTQRMLIFGLSSSHAAATLAIILIGYEKGILNEAILNGTIILILITCIVASFATEKSAKQLIIKGEVDTTELDERQETTEHILIPIANFQNLEKLVDFSILIKNKKALSPVTLLSIIPNNEEAERNVVQAKLKLENFVRMNTDSDTNINIITSIDFNIASGISRISKEIMADIVVLGWAQKQNLFEKLLGDKADSILYNTDKTIFISHFEKPLVTLKRIVVLCPPLVELEKGYGLWFSSISKLSQELSIPLVMKCNQKTKDFCNQFIGRRSLNNKTIFENFEDWEDFLVLSRDLISDDLLVFVSSRNGSVSYDRFHDHIPTKLEKHFNTNSRIIIYPKRDEFTNKYEKYQDMNAVPITKGLETIQKIGKGVGEIFKNREDN